MKRLLSHLWKLYALSLYFFILLACSTYTIVRETEANIYKAFRGHVLELESKNETTPQWLYSGKHTIDAFKRVVEQNEDNIFRPMSCMGP